ncbi:MAG: metal ABC transporter ATP-binding protein [Coprobacter sp.]|nr:metal ABC transporter ATP-binding protein [Coprobacter sp.]
MQLQQNKQIELSHIDLRYDSRLVLSGIDMSINANEFILITGPNGGGKTTLLRLILGLLPPSAGKLSYFRAGTPVASLNIGYLPQKSRIDAHFPITVSEVIGMGLLGAKLSREERTRMIKTMVGKVGLSDYTDTPIGDLSGGQLQRALFGRALITNPEVLVLDEPTSYIDKDFEIRMIELLQEVAHDTTILLVSHDIATFTPLADRIFRVQNTLTEL